MYNPDTDFLFPSRVIPELRSLRGPAWDALVDRARQAGQTDPEHLAFVLLMVNLNNCDGCNADSFKAMRGCTACSVQTIDRFSGKDEDLQKSYDRALAQVNDYLASIRNVT